MSLLTRTNRGLTPSQGGFCCDTAIPTLFATRETARPANAEKRGSARERNRELPAVANWSPVASYRLTASSSRLCTVLLATHSTWSCAALTSLSLLSHLSLVDLTSRLFSGSLLHQVTPKDGARQPRYSHRLGQATSLLGCTSARAAPAPTGRRSALVDHPAVGAHSSTQQETYAAVEGPNAQAVSCSWGRSRQSKEGEESRR